MFFGTYIFGNCERLYLVVVLVYKLDILEMNYGQKSLGQSHLFMGCSNVIHLRVEMSMIFFKIYNL